MLGGLDWLGQAWGAQDKVKMGFIFVGPRDDYGYNQAHFEGKSTVAKLDWVKAFDEEKVPETIEVQKTMESMVQLDGAQVLFPTSFGYFDPHILKVAPQYPNILFLHCGGSIKKANIPRTSVVISATLTNRSMWPASWPADDQKRKAGVCSGQAYSTGIAQY
jgi:simple sugar transport system substrate-binding protein